jgi:peptidoglycan/LPS O-acetylase OafA/YrhL
MTSGTEQHRPASRQIKLPFRPDIEGLRALAITLVVFSHAGLYVFRSGFIGVDIFFVLSGYLITSLLIQEIESSGRLNLARFYARRARRLLPAAMLLVIVVCLVEAVIVSPIVQFQVLKAAIATVFYSSNLYFAHLGLHYFDLESAVNPLLHTWSLAVEEQFYLVWPVLLLLLTKSTRSREGVTIALAAIAAVSFAFCIWLTAVNPVSAFFQPTARVWEFCAGGLIAYLPAARLAQHRRFCSWMGVTGILALLICAQFIRASVFPGYIAAFPVLGTAAVLLAGLGAPDSPIPRFLSTRPAQVLGGLSYSLYLWHWPALVISQQLFPSASVIVRLAAIAAALLLSVLTHRAVENPIRFSSYLVSRSGLTLKLAAFGALICACGLGGWRFVLNHSDQFRRFDRAAKDIPVLYSNGCAPEVADPNPRLCYFGATQNSSSTVVLFGDSHAAEWFPALEQIAHEQDWKLVTIVKPHCTALMIAEEVSPRMERVCVEWRRLAFSQIQQIHPNLILVSSASLHPVANGQPVTGVSIWEQAARGTFAALAETGAMVVFIRDTPHADYNILECMAQAEWDGRTHCAPVKPAVALYPDIYAAEVRGAAGLRNVGFIDLSDALCGAGQCYLQIRGMIVYRDMDHLTATYSRSLAGVLFQRLGDSLRR